MASLKSVKFTQPKPMTVDGCAVFFSDTYAVAANPTAADTIDFHLPAGAELHELKFDFPDLDTNVSPEWAWKAGYRKLNDGDTLTADDDYFAATGQTTGQSTGAYQCRFVPIKFDVDVIISITVEVDAATFAAGTIRMNAAYNCVGPK